LKNYSHGRFKIGESDSGRKLRVTLSEFVDYMENNRDDSPLYLFESSLEDHEVAKKMMKDYNPPKFFQQNFFTLLDEDEMPPHRWFLMGPKRSGSEIHIDPLGTSAWNTSLMGHKRWILIAPGPDITKRLVRGRHLMSKDEDDEAIHYFDFIFPRLK
jgi:histone arginine demethylase JMJD6